jgi:hypothetical protein
VAVVALLPFARGLLAGRSFFFRDLAGYFFPLRRFVVNGLLEGRLRYWNPLTHEGTPVALPPLGYPVDLLQALWPSETGVSVFLALHVPLAALGAFALARHLGLVEPAAVASALVYALGGFSLSSLNFYVYLQALAWAPFVVRGLLRAGAGTPRDAAWAALVLGVAVSTTGAEIVAQAALAGIVLAWPRDRRAVGRVALALLLGFGLAAAAALPVAALVEDSAREEGFATEVVLAHSVHPITLLQTVVAGLYGDPARLTDSFWGQNYFPRGFPYFSSLYVGALTVGLAFSGAAETKRICRRLAGLGALGLLVSLGLYAGLDPVVDALPALRRFRFPSKAFFTVHLSLVLLVGLALSGLSGGEPRKWRRTGVFLAALGTAVIVLPWLALEAGGPRRYLLSRFFPPELPWRAREAAAAAIVRDAAVGGVFAAGASLVAFLGGRRLVAPRLASWLIAASLAGDLLRAGAGLNPMVSPAFFRPSESAREIARAVIEAGGRLFTLDAGYSPAYYAARAARTDHEAWSFAVLQETLVPNFNLELGVPTALSLDQTMLVPEALVLPPEDASPRALPRVLPRLRAAAVSHVVSVEPLDQPELEPLAVFASARVAPLRLHLYRLRETLPRFELSGPGRVLKLVDHPGRLRLEVEAEGPSRLRLREAWARGWVARVDGRPVGLERDEGIHRALEVPAGRHQVELVYEPPWLQAGLAITLASALATAALLRLPRRQV